MRLEVRGSLFIAPYKNLADMLHKDRPLVVSRRCTSLEILLRACSSLADALPPLRFKEHDGIFWRPPAAQSEGSKSGAEVRAGVC